MRVLRVVFSAILLTVFLTSPTRSNSLAFSNSDYVEPILESMWAQHGKYATFTPVNSTTGNHEPLGCWSVAIAQILNHLNLQPHGHQYYEGPIYTVDEDLNHVFNWRLISPVLDDQSSVEEIEETALFCYYVAVIIQKKFGGGYVGNSDVRRAELHDHFDCHTTRVTTVYHTRAEIETFIVDELLKLRPLMLYIYPHAMVIDGFKREDGLFKVHINFGWEGTGDGWYKLWDDIETPIYTFTDPDRWVMAIIPDIISPTDAVFRITATGKVFTDKTYYGKDFITNRADIAECIETIEPVEPGDVVGLDPNNPGYYRKTRKAYSNLAVGVISSKPGFTLGRDENVNERTPAIALIGTVAVKATTENGHIQPGDLLTTSSKPGYVMVCKDKAKCAGAIIGKALEPLKEGIGFIRMLVMQ